MTVMYVYDALDYSLILRAPKRTVLKKELGITLNSNKVKLLKAGSPVMILSGSNYSKRPLFMSMSTLSEDVIEQLFVKYQLDRFHVEEESLTRVSA